MVMKASIISDSKELLVRQMCRCFERVCCQMPSFADLFIPLERRSGPLGTQLRAQAALEAIVLDPQ